MKSRQALTIIIIVIILLTIFNPSLTAGPEDAQEVPFLNSISVEAIPFANEFFEEMEWVNEWNFFETYEESV